MPRLNLLHINYSMEVGGIERMIMDFVRSCNRQDFSPHVCVFHGGGSMEQELRNQSIDLYTLNCRRGLDISLPLRLCRLLQEKNIRIIHTHNYGAWFYGFLACLMCKNVKHLHTEHSNVDNYRRRLWLENFLSRGTDRIVAVSNQVKTYLIERAGISPDKIVVLRNGVDTLRFRRMPKNEIDAIRKMLGFEEGNIVFGVVARLEPVKNHHLLLRAFLHVSNRNASARLLVVGDGSLRCSLNLLQKNLGLEGKVLFLGEREDIPLLLNAMDVYVLSSDNEGLNITLLEAMSTELPVIATNVGGNPEVVVDGRNGFLVPPGEDDAIANSMQAFLDAPSLAEEMGRRGRERIMEAFSLSRMIRDYENLYRDLCTDR